MACYKCNKKKIVWLDYTNKEYCEQHFLELIEKRIRKNFRLNKFDSKKKYYLPKKTDEQLLVHYYIQKIFGGRILLTQKRSDNIINIKSMNSTCQRFLDSFLKNTKFSYEFSPLDVVSDSEIRLATKLLGIKSKTRKTDKKIEFIDKIEGKDQNLLFSIRKSINNIIKS